MGEKAGDASAKADSTKTDVTLADVEPVVLDNTTIGTMQGLEVVDEKDLMGVDDGKASDDKSGEDDKSSEKKSADSGSKDGDSSGAGDDDKKAADDDAKGDDKAADDKKLAADIAKKGADEQKAADDKKAADIKKAADDKSDPNKDIKDEKTPKGLVKIEALHEARDIIKSLKSENAKLKVQQYEAQEPKAKAEPLVTKTEIKEFDGFQPLTDAEFEAKYEEDSKGGLTYLTKLNRYHDFQRRQTETKLTQQQQERELETAAEDLQKIYGATETLMEEVLPGIFDDSSIRDELMEFAEDIGFGEELFYLTNPETRIILPGASNPLVLGEQAADILKVLVTARTKLKTIKSDETDVVKLRADIEKELRVSIEKELLAKFKKSGDDKDYKSLDDIPTSDDENQFRGQVLSESELSRLTPAQQDAYLAGA